MSDQDHDAPAGHATPVESELTVHVVRVFTTEAGALGNPLGIVTPVGWPSTAGSALPSDSTEYARPWQGREQEIARRLGFSETVFVDAYEAEVGAKPFARIRIFTPAHELPFAGHPTVGTAWWLRAHGVPAEVLVVPAGDVGVRFAPAPADAETDAETGAAPAPASSAAGPALAADASGPASSDAATPPLLPWISARASWTPDFAWIPLADPSDVDALDPATFAIGHHYAYAWMDEPSGSLRSRMFAPEMGIVEDEATGAAAVSITARLGRDLDITQGQGSRIHTRHLGDELIEVGGNVVEDLDVSVHIG